MYGKTEKLDRPTVADLIRKLSTYPADMPVRLQDADTDWTICIIHFSVEKEKTLFLGGEYCEMEKT